MTNRQRIANHKAIISRAKTYEKRYARQLLTVLSKQYREAANQYADSGNVNQSSTQLEAVYRKIYLSLIPSEAKQSWSHYVAPIIAQEKGYKPVMQRKDILDDLASFLGLGQSEGEMIRLWRQIANDYFNLNILSRIRNVMDTTRKHLADIIEKGLQDGLGGREIARQIRDEASGDINKNRSLLIARTESMNAINRGQRLGMVTSPYYWDKRWDAFSDDRTRNSHRTMNSVDWLPLETAYEVPKKHGGIDVMDYPASPQGSAENVIQCRCSESYQVRRDANGRPIRKS